MSGVLEQLCRELMIEPGREVKPENHLIDDLGVERSQILHLINTRYPLLLTVSHDVPERSKLFDGVLDLPVESDPKGASPYTVQRLINVLEKCAECAYPDNGSS